MLSHTFHFHYLCDSNGGRGSTGKCTGGEAEHLDLDTEEFEEWEIVPLFRYIQCNPDALWLPQGLVSGYEVNNTTIV